MTTEATKQTTATEGLLYDGPAFLPTCDRSGLVYINGDGTDKSTRWTELIFRIGDAELVRCEGIRLVRVRARIELEPDTALPITPDRFGMAGSASEDDEEGGAS